MTQIFDRSKVKNVIIHKVHVNPKKALEKNHIQAIEESSKIESKIEVKKGMTTKNISKGFIR